MPPETQIGYKTEWRDEKASAANWRTLFEVALVVAVFEFAILVAVFCIAISK